MPDYDILMKSAYGSGEFSVQELDGLKDINEQRKENRRTR